MARMMDDAARAAKLSTLLDSYGDDAVDGNVNSGFPGDGAGRGMDEEQIQQQMPGNRPTRQFSPEMMPDRLNGPQSMIPVPASLAHAGMQALMSQASGGRSMGADGQLAGNVMSDDDMMREMQAAPSEQIGRVDPNNLPPVEDPEQIEMMRRGRERNGRQASLPIPADIPGEEPTTDEEVEAQEQRDNNRRRNGDFRRRS